MKVKRTVILTQSYRFEGADVATGVKAFYQARGVDLECPRAETSEPGGLVFIDRQTPPSTWFRYGNTASMANPHEAALAYLLAQKAGQECGGLANVMVMTPFRLQRKLIRSLFRSGHRQIVTSIDQSQGAERPIVIVSLVVDQAKHVARYLTAEKLNVAWSRARQKLILIGSFAALEEAYLSPQGKGAQPGVAALVETLLCRGRFEKYDPAPRLVEKARRKVEALAKQPPRHNADEWRERPQPSKTVLGELYRIPQADRALLRGVHRVRGRRR